MAIKITRKAAVQPIAPQDEVLAEVGLEEPKATNIKITRKVLHFPVATKVRIVRDHDWVAYYKVGDTGEVSRRWDAPPEARGVTTKPYELDLYEVVLDNPRSADHKKVLVHRHEIEAL